jgi:hypothetical protein
MGDLQDFHGIEEHVRERCRLAPTDERGQWMFAAALFLRNVDGDSQEKALAQLLEARRLGSLPFTEARVKELVDAAYDHPGEPRGCLG